MSLLFMMWLGIAMAAETSSVVHLKGNGLCFLCARHRKEKNHGRACSEECERDWACQKVSIYLERGRLPTSVAPYQVGPTCR